MRIFVFFFIFAYNLFVINGIPYALVKFKIYSKYYYYTIARIFFFLHFSIRIFPSGTASVIRRYLVLVLQTPVSRWVDYNN